MKSLERLEISRESLVGYSDLVKTALLDALWKNATLERLQIEDKGLPWAPIQQLHESFFQKVSVPLCLNRAGRKALCNAPSEEPLPEGLWPLVLERAMRLEYYSMGDTKPKLTSTRTDAVYWLLRKHIDMFV